MGNLVVVGSSNTDMIIQVPHLPAPGETILGGEFTTAAGGKGANQAVAAARAGGNVSLVACVGADMFGEQALAAFAEAGINTQCCVIDSDTPSGIAQIFVDANGENCIAVASGANACLTPRHIGSAQKLIGSAAVVVLQLETPLETVSEAAMRGREGGAAVILNPAPACPLPDDLYPLLSMITPNETEAELLTGVAVSDTESADRAARIFHTRGVPTVLITRGAEGVYLSQQTENGDVLASNFPAFSVRAVDTTAAGDVFNGTLAMGLADGDKLADAIQFAQAAAALSVQTLGAQTSAPQRSAIATFLQQNS
jgi:ribokinase